jgi:hypothetical protein
MASPTPDAGAGRGHGGVAVATRSVVDVDAWLLRAAGLFAVAVVLHNGDHLRRGPGSTSADVTWLGTFGVVVEVAVVVLVCQQHRLAPLAAAVTGVTLAAGYVLVHFLPERSWFSDSFTSAADVSPLSWLAASLEVVAAVALAVAGLAVLSRRGGLASASRPHPGQLSLREGLLHPLALSFALSQVVTLAITAAQA